MKNVLLIFMLLSGSVFAQNYKGRGENKASKMINLRKLVKTYKNQDVESLEKNGFVKDSLIENTWNNPTTNETIYMSENTIELSYTDCMVDNLFGSKNKTGMVLDRMWVRPWWKTSDVDTLDGDVHKGCTTVKVKGMIVAIVNVDGKQVVMLVD